MAERKLKVAIVGPAHPYRGGLAAIMQTMAREFQHRGYDVEILTFTLQYPSLLFPGKSQTVDAPAPDDYLFVVVSRPSVRCRGGG